MNIGRSTAPATTGDEQLDAMRRRLLVIHNPTAGRGRGALFQAVLQALRAAGADIRLCVTGRRGDAEAAARAADGEAYDALVVAGGDGTINEVVNGLGALAPPLGIVPLGTANVLAAELGLPDGAEALAAAILSGRCLTAHPGRVNGRRFLMMAGVGFDARVVQNVQPELKRRLGKAAYVWRSLQLLCRFDLPRYRVSVHGANYEVASLVVAKGHFYAGRFVCAPDARLDVPDFQLCLFRRGGRMAALRYVAALPLGLLPSLADVTLLAAKELRIEGPPGEPMQGDGELIGTLPAIIDVAPRPLRLIGPPG